MSGQGKQGADAVASASGKGSESLFTDRLPDGSPNRWVDPKCRYCKPSAPCLTHDRRPSTLAQNRVIFGPSFGHEPTDADHREAAFPWEQKA